MPLYLVQFEHEDEKVTCCLVRAFYQEEAYQKVEKWLSQDCLNFSANLYLDLENNDTLRIAGISEISSAADLEKCLPLIDEFSPNGESTIYHRNN